LILDSKATIEGAGVRLKRVFGYNEVQLMDPFLLLDDFHSDNPQDYMAGFPWHPHRGIETVTYMINGTVEHGDSMGNSGIINSGDIQWMTAGSGIIHQEMPQEYDGFMQGFQLWVNLPSSHKMMSPRYRSIIKQQIPEVLVNDDVRVKIIAGELNNTIGPVHDLVIDVNYFDINMPPQTEFEYPIIKGNNGFVYVFEGNGYFETDIDNLIKKEQLLNLQNYSKLKVKTSKQNIRFLFVSGKPIREQIAWRGPIVMNTQEELEQAFREYDKGTFIKG
jgi:redox-sensitive bicupin YhaK (pirin superfamily)